MKKLSSLIIAAVMVICMAVITPAQDVSSITVTLNGSKVNCESYGSPATIVDGRTLVPLRAIFEALGAAVEWDQSSKTVSSELDGTKITLTVGSNTLYRNGTFSLPEDWYMWNATCHHRDAVKYTDMFIALENKGEMKCFFNWGHAYEFENNKNNPDLGWTMIEGVMQKLAAEENIWKATNGEIYKYVEATKLAEVSGNKVKNNSDMTLYFNINGENVTLGAGQTYTAG